MLKGIKLRTLALSVVGCFLASSVWAAKTEIVMGFNPAENVEVVESNGKALSEYFQKKTGLKVKTFIATDYTALIEALRSGQIDFAWLPPFSYVKAEEIAGGEVLLKAVRKGRSVFYSAIFTRIDRPYKTIEDLKGKNIAWVDPTSASGHIFPKANLMVKKKIDADKFFNKQIFAGGHDAVVLAVLNNTVDAGATFVNDPEGKEGAWSQLFKGDEKNKVKTLFVTDPIPGDSMATSKKFREANPDIVKKTTELIQSMSKDEEGKKILYALYRIDSMIPAKSSDYDPLRKAAKLLNIN